ncbi:CAMK/CAMK-unique protein kinase [Ephemerocybe angulata]|uniref:CAMK/CAMK-unique protein kinase n=1 Tax=Ephemerocybe angulata TaxID=980116 RepID=A0A8H6I6Z8_9AGAR|nr:CAMK/CAMK-unique protein kinase [Tulosesus angulatus]
MLQYPVQLPPLSLSASSKHLPHDNVQFNAVRFQKDPYPARGQYQSRLPAPVVPLSVSTNLVPSPSSSSPRPRSPYISSRQLSSPAPYSAALNAPTYPSALSQCASFGGGSTLEDALAPGDIIGEDLYLQGEMVHLVSSTPDADGCPPAREFEVVRRLGTGSYAEVLSRAAPSEDGHSIIGSMELDGKHHPQTVYGREFAIKLLSKANLDEEALEAQMSEVTIHQSLRLHPNIVTLYRTLETSSFLLLLLEYVPGEDLYYFLEQSRDHYDPDSNHTTSDSISASRTPPTPSLLSNLHPSQLLSRTRLRLIASMFSQMCDAVAACHAQNVFHRDIKPENFIVTDGWMTLPDGREERRVIVKLTDFGLSTTDLESSDMDCGSAPYMSFECRNNVAPTYSPRAADVWSLGIVLINMLYHHNPWTDTAEGACNPVNFFVTRFPGMTRPVVDFLANNVFCVLDNSKNDDSQRISAAGFGAWVKNLPTLLAAHPMHRTVSTGSTRGHSITSIPISHRPTSRHPSVAAVMRTPAMTARSLSRAPSLGPADEREERSELSIVYDHEGDEDLEVNGEVIEPSHDPSSRSASTTKRRKRGARKGKGGSASSPTATQDNTLATLAVASQSLARELSKQSTATKTSTTSSRSQQSFEPVSVYAMPLPLLNPRTTSNSAIPSPPPPASPPATVTKKPSRWKLSFGKASASTLTANLGRASPTEEIPPPVEPQPVASTVSNVTSLIMGLNAPPPPPPSAVLPSNKSDDGSSTWSRGRSPRDIPTPGQNSSRSPGRSLASKSQTNLGLPDRASARAISPNSTRSGRPVASSASSMVSGNWRSSMSTTSSAGTSTSAFTRYSNSSMRSVSTTATSVSAASWRTSVKQPSISSKASSTPSATGGYTTIPKNIKIITGVPWELDQVPRQQYTNPTGDIFGAPPPRKQRTRKHKDMKLDTITERPIGPKSPESTRKDAMTSTTDLPVLDSPKEEGEGGVKKVHKGQINALAKMLSALRR